MQDFDFGTLRGASGGRDAHESYRGSAGRAPSSLYQAYDARAPSSVYQAYNGKAASSVYSGPGPAEEATHYSLYSSQNFPQETIPEEKTQLPIVRSLSRDIVYSLLTFTAWSIPSAKLVSPQCERSHCNAPTHGNSYRR
jgi:hypothetical protein